MRQVVLHLDASSIFDKEFYSNSVNYNGLLKFFRSEQENRLEANKKFLDYYSMVELMFRNLIFIPFREIRAKRAEFKNSNEYWKETQHESVLFRIREFDNFLTFPSDVYDRYSNSPSFLFVISSFIFYNLGDMIPQFCKFPELAKHTIDYHCDCKASSFPSALYKVREIVELLVRRKVDALQFANDFRNDHDIVIRACSHNSNALQFASKEMRNNKEVVMKCLGRKLNSLFFVGESLLGDLHVLRRAMWAHHIWRTEEVQSMNFEQLVEEIIKKKPIFILKFYHLLKERGLEIRIDLPLKRYSKVCEIIIEQSPLLLPFKSTYLLKYEMNRLYFIEDPELHFKILNSGCIDLYKPMKQHCMMKSHTSIE